MGERKRDDNYRPVKTALGEDSDFYQKPEIKTEKQKWSELSKKQKRRYFRDYYLWKTLGVALGVFIVAFLIIHFATKTTMVMGVMAVNTDGTHIEATSPDYFNDFLEANGVNPKKEKVNLNYTIWIDPNSGESVDTTSLETIQTLFMTRSVEVFFSDETFFKCMAGTDYLVDIRDYLPEELIEKYQDDIVWTEVEETGETIAAGIRLRDNAWVKATGWYDGEVVVGMAHGMKSPELATALMEEILK